MAGFTQPVYKIVCVKVLEGIFCVKLQIYTAVEISCNRYVYLYWNHIVTSLAKEVMFLVELVSLSVCLSVCLSADNIIQKVMNGLGWNFMDGFWVVQGRTD